MFFFFLHITYWPQMTHEVFFGGWCFSWFIYSFFLMIHLFSRVIFFSTKQLIHFLTHALFTHLPQTHLLFLKVYFSHEERVLFVKWSHHLHQVIFFLSCDISVLWGCDISIRVLGQWQWVLSTIIVHVHTVWMLCKVCAEMIRMQFNSMFHGSWRTSANSQP